MNSLPVGHQLGHYRLLEVLRSGGASITYLAKDEQLGKLFSVQEFYPDEASTRDGVTVKAKSARADDFARAKDRFKEEARQLARFRHSNILSVIQIFEANGTVYIVFEHLSGRSVREWLDELGRAPTQSEVDLLIEPLLDALETIHRSNLLHLQIDTRSIFIRDDGSPLFLDPAIRSQHSLHVGDFRYAAVELASSRAKGRVPWTDIYALAATLYYALKHAAPPDSTERLLNDEYAPVARRMSDGLRSGDRHLGYRAPFLAAIDWGLKLAPKDRPQSIAEWRAKLFEAVPQPTPRRIRPKIEISKSHLPSGIKLLHYEILEVLGAGGFGVTYLANDELSNKRFAIKEYFPDDFAQRTGTTVRAKSGREGDFVWGKGRFVEEAQMLARFKHPNIVDAIQIFEANDTAYLVLGFQDGRNFTEWLTEFDDAPDQSTLDSVVRPILAALDLVHRNKVLHRDVAPNNIYICSDGSPVLLDFGSAREAIAHRTNTITAMVKSGYSPIEQYSASGSDQGPWTDIYALSATLYQAVTGMAPIEATERILADRLVSAAIAASERHTRLGKALRYRPAFLAAIDWGLRPVPKDRPQTVAEWNDVLFEGKARKPSWFAWRQV